MKRSLVAIATAGALTAVAIAPTQAATTATGSTSLSSTSSTSGSSDVSTNSSDYYGTSSQLGSSDLQSWFNSQGSTVKGIVAGLVFVQVAAVLAAPIRTMFFNLFRI